MAFQALHGMVTTQPTLCCSSPLCPHCSRATYVLGPSAMVLSVLRGLVCAAVPILPPACIYHYITSSEITTLIPRVSEVRI